MPVSRLRYVRAESVQIVEDNVRRNALLVKELPFRAHGRIGAPVGDGSACEPTQALRQPARGNRVQSRREHLIRCLFGMYKPGAKRAAEGH